MEALKTVWNMAGRKFRGDFRTSVILFDVIVKRNNFIWTLVWEGKGRKTTRNRETGYKDRI